MHEGDFERAYLHKIPQSTQKTILSFGFIVSNADGSSFLDPLFWGQGETVQIGLGSNPVEFDVFEIGIVELFPNTRKFYSVTVSETIPHKVVRAPGVLIASDIRDANMVILFMGKHGYGGALYFDSDFLIFVHFILPPFSSHISQYS